MTSITIATLLSAGVSYIGEQNVYALPVPIALPGFESPTLGDGEYSPTGCGGCSNPTEWTFTGSSGVFNPTSVYIADEAHGGDNTGYTNDGSICQTLTSQAVEENTHYELSVWVGSRSDGSPYPNQFTIELLDEFDTSLASLVYTDGSATVPDAGTWVQNTLAHTVWSGDSSIGNDLKICLSSPVVQSNFDDVSLEAYPVQQECSDNDEICKTIIIVHDDLNSNGYIEPHEPVTYITRIDVQNPTGFDWEDVKVQDNLGGDLTIGGSDDPEDDLTTTDNLDCSDSKTQGKTKKVQLRCDVEGDGTLGPTDTATLGFTAMTDLNPGQGKKTEPKVEYTSCGIHYANSGSTVSGFDTDSQSTFAYSTDGIFVEVFTADKLGDCDGDLVIDADDLCPFEGLEETGSVDLDGCPIP